MYGMNIPMSQSKRMSKYVFCLQSVAGTQNSSEGVLTGPINTLAFK